MGRRCTCWTSTFSPSSLSDSDSELDDSAPQNLEAAMVVERQGLTQLKIDSL